MQFIWTAHSNQNREIECLRKMNRNLESELDMLHEEIEEYRIRGEKLNSELHERSNDFELWEAEATTFYFDLQASSVHEVLFENKVHELTGVCENLEDESASKSIKIQQMRERVSFLESEIGGLKALRFHPTKRLSRENQTKYRTSYQAHNEDHTTQQQGATNEKRTAVSNLRLTKNNIFFLNKKVNRIQRAPSLSKMKGEREKTTSPN
ncbi:unnamed protein product, partial [Vitis vinifera]